MKPEAQNPKSESSPATQMKPRKWQYGPPSRKLKCPNAPITKLKLLWLQSLSEAEKDYWREQFASARPQSKLRQELLEKLHIELVNDTSLTRFRRWVYAQDVREEEAERVVADTAELRQQGLRGEELREALLERMKGRALALGDFSLGAVAVRLDLQAEAMALRQAQFKESKRTKVQAGLAGVLAEAKGNPAIAAAVKQIQAATE